MSVKVTKKCITLTIDGEDVETLSDICEVIRIIADSQSNHCEFSGLKKRLRHHITVDWDKAKYFMHKVLSVMD